VLIPVIAIAVRRIDGKVLETPNPRTKKFFSDFWLYAIVFGFVKDDSGIWPQDWYDGVKEIAAKAPKLTFNTGEKAEIRSLLFFIHLTNLRIDLTSLFRIKILECKPGNIQRRSCTSGTHENEIRLLGNAWQPCRISQALTWIPVTLSGIYFPSDPILNCGFQIWILGFQSQFIWCRFTG